MEIGFGEREKRRGEGERVMEDKAVCVYNFYVGSRGRTIYGMGVVEPPAVERNVQMRRRGDLCGSY